MKKPSLLLAECLLLALIGCQNPEKSTRCMDEGVTLMMRSGSYAEAEEAFTKAIRYDKNNYEAYYYRGCAKINAAHYQDAIPDLEEAIAIKPDYADAYFNLGRVHYLLGNSDKACEYYKLAEQYGRPNLEDYLKRCP